MFEPAPVEPTDDPARAARRIMTDTGMLSGILYRGDRQPYQPEIGRATHQPSDLEKEFVL